MGALHSAKKNHCTLVPVVIMPLPLPKSTPICIHGKWLWGHGASNKILGGGYYLFNVRTQIG